MPDHVALVAGETKAATSQGGSFSEEIRAAFRSLR
jgi:hypothetical protein